MALIYDNTGLGPTGGQWEYGGTGDGSPPLGTDVKKVASWTANGATILPPQGCTSFTWVQFNDSDGSYNNNNSGLRTMARRGVTFPNYGPGFEIAVVIAACNIGQLHSAMWVAPFEYHHTGTNLATTPTHIMMNSGGIAIDSFYGPSGAAHDNSQRQTNFNLSFNGGKYDNQNVWHVFVHHIKVSTDGTGLINIYHGVEGTDSAVTSLSGLRSNVSTTFVGTSLYELVGIYHGSGHAELLIAGWKGFSTVAEGIAWAATLLGGTPPATDSTPPTTPTSLVATASGTSITLTWVGSTDAGSGVAGYRVERCEGVNCFDFTLQNTVVSSFVDTGLNAATPYSYRIQAVDAANNVSAYSNTATATTGAAPPPPVTTLPTLTRDRRLGVLTAGSGLNGFTANFKSGSKFATGLGAGEAGDVKDIHLYWKGNTGTAATQKLTAGFYKDDAGGGDPGTKLGESDVEWTANGNDAAGWHTVSPTAIRISGVNVWIIVGAGATSNTVLYSADSGVGGLRYGADTYEVSAPRLSSPAGSMSTDAIIMSIAADYDVVGGSSPPPAGDTTPPVLQSLDCGRDNIYVHYNEPLSSTSIPFNTDWFLFISNAQGTAQLRNITATTLSGSDFILTTELPIFPDDLVKLGYRGTAGHFITDVAGNKAPDFNNLDVVNGSALPFIPHRVPSGRHGIGGRFPGGRFPGGGGG